MINTVTHLKIFDSVVNYLYRFQKPNKNVVTIPQEDFEKFEKARKYALYLNSQNLLYEFYCRILRGTL